MKPLIQSFPSLGQVTTTKSGNVTLIALLEASAELAHDPWEVSLWISIDDGDWKESKLSKIEDGSELNPQAIHSQNQDLSCLYFSCSLSLTRSARFTFHYRQRAQNPWTWVRDQGGLGDGIIIVQSSETSTRSAKSTVPCIPNINPEWNITSRLSQSPQTHLWSLQCSIPSADDQASALRDVGLGTPWGSFVRWFALVRHQPSWLGPRQGESQFLLEQDGIICTFLSPQGKTMALLAVSGVSNVSVTFRHGEGNTVKVQARNDSPSPAPIIVLVSEGLDFGHAVAAVMYEARNLLSPYAVSQASRIHDSELQNTASPDWKASWLDGLGFCTWNSLGQQLSEDLVLKALAKLAENGIHISNLIIDDNWQSLDHCGSRQTQYGWSDFEADKQGFPSGLQGLVKRIKSSHPGVRHILVWHTLLGYWGGIARKGAISESYKTVDLACDSSDNPELTVIAKEDISRFYDDFYKFLVASGIDGVKTDAQVMLDTFNRAPDRRNLIPAYLDEWMKASQKHFGAQTISCMSQYPHALFLSQLPWRRQEFVVRNSDDYFPDEPDSHAWHVWTNAHNAVFTQFLNAVPDWDMFQTTHDFAGFHAAARCVSSGPIWITDVPGEHDLHLLKQIVAITPGGQTIILRPNTLGKTTDTYNAYQDGSVLKVGSYVGSSQAGIGIIATFNVSRQRVVELLPLDRFPGLETSLNYVVRSHRTGFITTPMSLESAARSLVKISLDIKGYDVLTAFPLFSFEGKQYGRGHAGVLGLLGKMTGCAAITSSSTKQLETGSVAIAVGLKALGVLGFYVSALSQMNIADNFMVLIEDNPVPLSTVRRNHVDNCILEVDVEKAWETVKLSGVQLDQLLVKVTFTP